MHRHLANANTRTWIPQKCIKHIKRYGGFHKHGGTQKWMVYFMENPFYKLDDLGYLGVAPFMESSICESIYVNPPFISGTPHLWNPFTKVTNLVPESAGCHQESNVVRWLWQVVRDWANSEDSVAGLTWENHGKILVFMTHDGSMVLLYMVLHGSHQYTPVMLAYIPAPWIRHG